MRHSEGKNFPVVIPRVAGFKLSKCVLKYIFLKQDLFRPTGHERGGFQYHLGSSQTFTLHSWRPPACTRCGVCKYNLEQLEEAHAFLSTNIYVSTNSLGLGVGWIWGWRGEGKEQKWKSGPSASIAEELLGSKAS